MKSSLDQISSDGWKKIEKGCVGQGHFLDSTQVVESPWTFYGCFKF